MAKTRKKASSGGGGALYYSGALAFIDEVSGVLVQPGRNEIADPAVAEALVAAHEDCSFDEDNTATVPEE